MGAFIQHDEPVEFDAHNTLIGYHSEKSTDASATSISHLPSDCTILACVEVPGISTLKHQKSQGHGDMGSIG
jgi:hypothetical protein